MNHYIALNGIPVIHADKATGTARFLLYPAIQPGTSAWFAWLAADETMAFDFYDWESDDCLCHVRKSRRQHRSFWYAYRRGRTKVRRRSLGHSEQLTLARLWEVTDQLVQAELEAEGATTRQF
jgi:hypothetical protein